jgi:hypothetical protein
MPPAMAPPQGIDLPELRPELKSRVQYPGLPQIPPTTVDVADAVILCHDVYEAFRQSHPSLTDGKC